MEAAPLTLAYTHARNAAHETKRSNSVAASEEHDLAAAEFASAAQSTQDTEAQRILNLLEQYHKKLGHILRSPHPIQDPHPPPNPGNLPSEASSAPTNPNRSQSPEAASQPPRLLRTARPTARDLSSSIASNLASARGIPSNRQKRSTPVSPLVSNQHVGGRFSQDLDSHDSIPPRRPSTLQSARGASINSNRPSWAPPADINETDTEDPEPEPVDPHASDAPFQQFYSTFESLMSKLSAPLAFAGLPLTVPSAPVATNTATTTNKPQSHKAQPSAPSKSLEASINYSQLISRAALKAVSRNDKSSPYGNPSESFYVVPTTGGTTSYAEIMTRADREASHHRRNISNLSAGTTDDFEDAPSTILPPPPVTSSRAGLSNERKFEGKTMEELSLENKALKHLSDTLSKRLHVFEMSAQTSSAALAQSIRSLHLSPLATPENSRGKSATTTAFNPDSTHANIETVKLKSRITELEEILRKSDSKVRKRDDENAKLRENLTMYRDKWDRLKAGAKARRERVVGESAGAGRARVKSGSDAGTATEKDDQDAESVV